jgi:predicted metal-binding protein
MEERLESYLNLLCQRAKELGVSEAVAIPATDIVVDERVALKCLAPRCPFYGTNLMCPPNVMPISQFQNILKRYHGAILLKMDSVPSGPPEELTGSVEITEIWEAFKAAGGEEKPPSTPTTDYLRALRNNLEGIYKITSQIEALCLEEGYHFAAGLSATGCLLCDQCVGPGEPCRHPLKARPAMDALGIDVGATVKKAGMQLSFAQKETRSWVWLILVD